MNPLLTVAAVLVVGGWACFVAQIVAAARDDFDRAIRLGAVGSLLNGIGFGLVVLLWLVAR